MSAVLAVTLLFPRLHDIFSQIGPDMAGKVESLMSSLSVTFVAVAAVVLWSATMCACAARARKKGGPLAVRIDAFFLRVPLVASFLIQRELLNFTFAMETLTASGVSMDEALSEGAGATGNRALKQEIFEIREKVMKGEHLSTAFSRSSLFPTRVARWMGIGERVGHVEKVFGQLRAYYQQEVEKWIQRLIEPALIVVLGLLIILFVVFFIVPIFSLYGNVL